MTDDSISELVERVKRIHPGFTGRGASRTDIERLQRLIPRQLPADYVEFLECLGACTGGLLDNLAIGATVDDLLEHYQEESSGGASVLLPGGCVVVGVGVTSDEHLGIRLDDGEDAQVVWTADDEILSPVAASFVDLLWQQAFLRYYLNLPTHSLICVSSDPCRRIDAARRLFAEDGLEIDRHSDKWTLLASRRGRTADLALAWVEPEGSGPWLRIAGDDESEVERLAERYASELGLRLRGPFQAPLQAQLARSPLGLLVAEYAPLAVEDLEPFAVLVAAGNTAAARWPEADWQPAASVDARLRSEVEQDSLDQIAA